MSIRSIRHGGAYAVAAVLTLAGAATAAPAQAATSALTCDTGVWKASYYANTTFKGTAKKTVCDKTISENYGTGDPAGVTLPKDNFGVRWTVTRNFGSGGPFSFSASVRDGIRVYLDGTRKINLWKDVTKTQKKTVNVTVPKGKHTIRVDFAAFKGTANVAFAYAPRTSASVDKVKPLAPTGVKATYSSTTLKAALTWAKSPEMDLAGYRVERRPAGTDDWAVISGTALLTATKYQDTPPPTGQKYVYAIRAVDKARNASDQSGTGTATTPDLTAPATPGDVKATYLESTGVVDVTWSWVTDSDFKAYRVYRRTGADGDWVRLPDTVSRSQSNPRYNYDQLPGGTAGTYYYAVTAVDTIGNESAKSPVSDATTVTLTETSGPPAGITGLTGTATEYGIELDWDDSAATDLDHYEVYTGDWELNGYDGTYYFSKRTTAKVGADTSHYRLVKALGSSHVLFMVVAVDTSGNITSYDLAPTLDVAPIDLLTAPTSVPKTGTSAVSLAVSQADAGGVLLDWYCSVASVCDRITGYNVYAYDYTAGAYVKLNDAVLPTVPSSYTDATAAAGTTHVYRVTAVLDDGTESYPAEGYIALAPTG